ncbi:MAG: TIGR01459 family HAD-type hydrolase [Pseudomonadota bacterium]
MHRSDTLHTIIGLSEVADQYDALLCDAWGVIHNGRELYPGVGEALTQFRQTRGPVIILTNAPRPSDIIPAQLDQLGLPRGAYDGIVTSGDATRAAVAAQSDKPFFRLGPDKDDALFNSLPITLTELEDAQIILCTGPFNDQTDTPEDYREMLTSAAASGLPMICANPDKVVKFGDKLIYCAGALADLYVELGGNVILCGKPHKPIYTVARRALGTHNISSSARLLAIGDGLQTDILGANQEGIDVIFVAEGIFSTDARGDDGTLSPSRLSALLKQHNVHAEYAMDGLKW